MDINLPLILFLAVAGTGIVWLVDFVLFQKKRTLAVDQVESQFEALNEEDKQKDTAYQTAISSVGTEPLIVEYSKSFFPVLLLVFVLRSFVVEPFQIPSESMVPTLEVGDFILVNKFSYGIRLPLIRTKVFDISDPARGDVMVFFPPHEDRYFIKRVVGLPGDTVRIDKNNVYVNGELIEHSEEVLDVKADLGCPRYVMATETFETDSHVIRKCEYARPGRRDGEWLVQEGSYFMMGDNRDNSSDSRVWGPVPEERIVGKAFAIWMHWESFVSIPSFSRVGSI